MLRVCSPMGANIPIRLINAGIGFLLGLFYDAAGVVVACVFSLSLGSSVINLSYRIRHKIPLIELMPKGSTMIILACLVGTLSRHVINYGFSNFLNPIALNIIILISFSPIVFVPFCLHPMRKLLIGWLG